MVWWLLQFKQKGKEVLDNLETNKEGQLDIALEEFNSIITDNLIKFGTRKFCQKDPNQVNKTRKKIDSRIRGLKIEKKRLSRGIVMAITLQDMTNDVNQHKLSKKLQQYNDSL